MTDEQKLYNSAAGFEDRADEANEAKRIANYIATHVRCTNGHHRLKNPNVYDNPCPVEGCGKRQQFLIDPADVPKG